MESLIRRKRRLIGIPQSVVARKLKISRTTLESWELRKTTPAMNKIEMLAAILNLKFVDVAKDYIYKEDK